MDRLKQPCTVLIFRRGCPYCVAVDAEWRHAKSMLKWNTYEIDRASLTAYEAAKLGVQTVPRFIHLDNRGNIYPFGDSTWLASQIWQHSERVHHSSIQKEATRQAPWLGWIAGHTGYKGYKGHKGRKGRTGSHESTSQGRTGSSHESMSKMTRKRRLTSAR
jgi:hypothetical protein